MPSLVTLLVAVVLAVVVFWLLAHVSTILAVVGALLVLLAAYFGAPGRRV